MERRQIQEPERPGPSSRHNNRIVSPTNFVSTSGSKSFNAFTSAAPRTGVGSTGPPSVNSRPRPIASAGIKISENIISRRPHLVCARAPAKKLLGGKLGRFRYFQKRVLLADFAILRQVATRLTHDPDGRALGTFASGSAAGIILCGSGRCRRVVQCS